MHPHRALLLIVALCTLAAFGCGSNPAANPPATPNAPVADGSNTTTSPLADNPSTNTDSQAGSPPQSNTPQATRVTPKSPEKPSPEQIAKWAIPEFEPLQLLACSDGFGDPTVLGMAISPDGKQFVLGGARLTLWNTKDSQPIVNLLENYKGEEVERPLRAVAISADGKWLAAGDQKGSVRIWTMSDQTEVVAIQVHNGHVSQLAFSPDSHLLATTSYSGDVNLWQLPAGTKLKSLKMDKQEIARLVFLSDNLIASAGSEVSIWDIESGSKETSLTNKYVRGPALGLSRDRRLLAFNGHDSTVQFWAVQNSKLTGQTLRGAGAYIIDFSSDGKWIATGSSDSTIRIWDAATGTVVQVIDADGGRTSALQWLPDSKSLIIASELGRVRIWGTPDAAQTLGIEPIQLPPLESTAAGTHTSLTPAQLQRVIDLRSFPRLPEAVPQWGDFRLCSYFAPASQKEAELFYRYYLAKAGWTEGAPSPAAQPGLLFRKAACELNVFFAPATADPSGRQGDLQISLQFAGNYDVRWLPKFSAIDSKSNWDSFSSLSYRTKADLTEVEVALLKQFHEAGWTAYTRLAASGTEDPKSRSLSMLQGGSELTVSIGYPADSTQELFVQTSVSVSNKSLPIPPDAGWIEFDSSTDLQLVINNKMDLQQTAQSSFDAQMAAEGWLAREAGRKFKDDKGWLPYIRGQQDIFLRLSELPGGGTRIVAGDAARSSWQLEKPVKSGEKNAAEKTDKPGIEAADFALPAGALAVRFDVDQKKIEFEVIGSTPGKLGEQFVAQMDSLGWKRESAGVISDEYVFITYSKGRAEIQIRARAAAKKATAMINGDGLLWTKPLPTPPVRISYGTWLRRDRKPATLDLLDEFKAEMQKIPASR